MEDARRPHACLRDAIGPLSVLGKCCCATATCKRREHRCADLRCKVPWAQNSITPPGPIASLLSYRRRLFDERACYETAMVCISPNEASALMGFYVSEQRDDAKRRREDGIPGAGGDSDAKTNNYRVHCQCKTEVRRGCLFQYPARALVGVA